MHRPLFELYGGPRLLRGADQRLWLVTGVLLGVGTLTQLTTLFLGHAIFLSLWMVPERKWYGQPWVLDEIPDSRSLHNSLRPLAVVARLYFLAYASTYAGRREF